MSDTNSEIFRQSIGVIGCGSLGTAILRGILSAEKPRIVPSKILATVKTKSSAEALKKILQTYSKDIEIDVHFGGSAWAAEISDVIVLACPPDRLTSVLQEQGMGKALNGKLVISVLAGTPTEKIMQTVRECRDDYKQTWVARTLPNLAVAQHASATAIEMFSDDFPTDKADFVLAFFQQLGGIVQLPSSLMEASTVLCGSTPAWFALFADGLVDGAVAAGVPRSMANDMIAQVLGSTAALLHGGKSPSSLRESVCAMPGCTIQGNMVLENHGVRAGAADAMKTAIVAASKLGD